jgi:peptidoglycan/LPS O-acetylase OafA/YrhL
VEREHGVDRVKAVAALCVVAIHSQNFFVGRTDLIGRVMPVFTEWAVPAFFFVGGYVRARTTPYSPGTTRGWLTRLLPVYLLASLLALMFRYFVYSDPVGLVEVVRSLLIGSAWGIYYFVPLFLGALICSHGLARYPQSVGWICTLSVVCLVATRADPDLDPLWRLRGFEGIMRSPLFWWGYFFAGWLAKQKLERVETRGRIFLLSSLVAVISVLALLAEMPRLETAVARVSASISIPMALLFLSKRQLGPVTAVLSEYSYEIYLFHYFAIAVARHWGYSGSGFVMPLAVWVFALTTALAVGIMTRRALQQPRYTAATSH